MSTSDAHLGDVRVHMCITASDLRCTEHVSRHRFSQELELTPSPSTHRRTHICMRRREDGHEQELHELNKCFVFLSKSNTSTTESKKKCSTSV